MSDALVSPPVGVAMWAVSAAVAVYSVKKVAEADESHSLAPKMGVMGAFIFAAQMINFAIPGTGSSGHLGGGLLLAVLLGPWAGYLTIASVLAIQALFFADGGILAYGCNVFNLGFVPCLIAYPLLYRLFDRPGMPLNKGRVVAGSLVASVVGLQLGAFCVVLQTWFSGISELPFMQFVLLMQPIHLAIGVVEGIVTAAVIVYIRQMAPGWQYGGEGSTRVNRKIVVAVLAATALVAGVLSWFASPDPDGLEWAAAGTSGQEELVAPESGIYRTARRIQEWFAFLPDYGFRSDAVADGEEAAEAWPNVSAGTSVSGIAGASFLIIIACAAGQLLRKKKEHPCHQ